MHCEAEFRSHKWCWTSHVDWQLVRLVGHAVSSGFDPSIRNRPHSRRSRTRERMSLWSGRRIETPFSEVLQSLVYSKAPSKVSQVEVSRIWSRALKGVMLAIFAWGSPLLLAGGLC